MKERLKLTLACTESDHTHDFTEGPVEADGIDLTYLALGIPEMFYRFTKYREFDVSEMSFGKYVALRSQGDDSLAAIPVFPSRVFRHSSIYVRRGGEIRRPEDLRGRRVGIPEWAQTAAIYTRGMLAHEYGVALGDIQWVQGGVTQPGREEKVSVALPPGVRLEAVKDRSLDAMLVAGDLDALLTADPPPSFERGSTEIVRLFDDYRAAERTYYRKTGIFPIMHLIALRGEILAENPWVARSLYKAFDEAKRRSIARLENAAVACFPLPWIPDIAEDVRREFGDDWWPYGIEPNRTTLEAFAGFAFEQGVAQRRVDVEELFPESMRGPGYRV
jgi:4,5-dihydroxyphthalate decarboxylase